MTSADSPDLSAKLTLIDEVASASLRPASIIRYAAYRNAMIADEQDPEQLVQSLWLFIWNLADECSVNGVH